MDGGRVKARGTAVFRVRQTDAREGAKKEACLDLERSGVLRRAAGSLSGQRMPEPSSEVQSRAGTDAGPAALADRLGRLLLAGSSPFRTALVGAAAAC